MKSPYSLVSKLLLLVVLLVFVQCERRPLLDVMPDTVLLPLTVYWEEAGVQPQNVTALFYDGNGDLYKEVRFENSGAMGQTQVSLHAGHYTVVVFNELRDQIANLRIRGHEKLSTLEAFVVESSQTYQTQTKANGDKIIREPGQLASVVKQFVISPLTVREYHSTEPQTRSGAEELTALLNLYPLPKTSQIDVTLEVKGLHNARMPAMAELRNLAQSYLFGADKNGTEPATVQFLVNNRQYFPGSWRDGTISAQVSTLGLLGKRNSVQDTKEKGLYLDVHYQLVDAEKTLIKHSFEISDQIEITELEGGKIHITLHLVSGTLPDVKPEGGSDSGMSSDLIDWDTVKVPIKI